VQTSIDDVGLGVGRCEGCPESAGRQPQQRRYPARNLTLEEAMMGNYFFGTRPSILEAQQSNNMRAEGRQRRINLLSPACMHKHARASGRVCVLIDGGLARKLFDGRKCL
jgi:hypothetical protein